MDHLYRELGRRLRKARKNQDLTQAALAERVGVSRTSITNVEQGNQHVPIHVLYQLARALGVPPSSLLPDEGALDRVDEPDNELKHLRPKERRQVAELLQQIPDDQRKWVYRVIEGGKGDGN